MNISAENLCVKLGGKEILHEINVSFSERSLSLVIGGNGSGKSTLLKVLSGIIPATGGSVSINGTGIRTLAPAEISRRCAVLLQNPYAPPEMSVAELVAAGRFAYGRKDLRGREAIRAAMADSGAEALCDRKIGTLSGGERRKAFLARALAQETPVLLLDEPDAALDAAAKDVLRQSLHQLKLRRELCIVMAVHDLDFALDIADKVCGLRKGTLIFAGTAQNVVTPANFQNLYGISWRIFREENGCCHVAANYSRLNS